MSTALIRDSLKFAFTKLFKYWWIAVPRLLVNALIIGGVMFCLCIAGVYGYGLFGSESTELKSIMLILTAPMIILTVSIISLGVVSIFTVAANTKITLDLYDQKKTPFFMFNQIGNGIVILCSAIILSIATFFSLFLLIFPAIYLSLRWMFFTYATIDLGKGPFGSLAQSWRTTRAIKKPLFWISIILVIVTIVKVFFLSKYGYLETLNSFLETPKAMLNNPTAFISDQWKMISTFTDTLKTQKSILLSLMSLASIIFASLAHLFVAGLYRKLSRSEQK